ncbi:MAG TPA: hydrogenase nickel incorporation protein HypB [Longimicrobiales bacterium]|nr:hydrogenase nickel incorporation protein HypB [Longimicrobiales bacterium]
MKIVVAKEILKANDQVALENRESFEQAGVAVINVMASPGAGKTSTILATIERLLPDLKSGVIEGDIASTIDADKIAERGIPVVQINTGGTCHLDAPMVRNAIEHLPLNEIDVLFVENVGNLICPTSYKLGSHINLVIASVPEGWDKPYKYPGIFAAADVVLLNKADMIEVFEFDVAAFERGVRMVNPDVDIMHVSCKTNQGLDQWAETLRQRLAELFEVAQ